MPVRKRQRRLLLSSIAVALVTLLVLAMLEWRTRHDVYESVGWVTHTIEVERELYATMLLLSQAESAQRRFLLTGSKADLDAYDSAQRDINAAISQLQQRTSDNRRQQKLLQELQALTAEMMAQLSSRRQEAQARSTGVNPDPKDGRERELADSIRAITSESLREEETLLRGRQATLAAALARRAIFIWIALGIVAAASASAVYFLRRLQRLEPIVQVCAWSKAIKDGDEWISFETYLQRRFDVQISHGISPAELDKLDKLEELQELERSR